ncbi:MAG: DUF2795 domain-containing protein [Chloroflexi bacterium]|nr:DUF2795 domain-containing protein [Chloroflexota bacterium]
MSPVPWSAIAKYVEEAHSFKGRVERADCMDLAFANHAPDDVIDALDALGSRLFPTVAAAREFLVAQNQVAP